MSSDKGTQANPFWIGQPVSSSEAFIGRTMEINVAFDQIYNRSNLAVWGSPGMGKSSFLEQLTLPEVWQLHGLDPSKAVIVLLDCLNIVPFNASRFWKEAIQLTRDKLDSEPTLQAEIDTLLAQGKTTSESLRLILRKLGKQDKFLLLLVDNYDHTLYPHKQYTEEELEAFLSECRTLTYHSLERQYVSMIVTSSRRLNELRPKFDPQKSPWYNHYLFLALKPFTETEVNSLLNRAPMLKAFKEEICELAYRHPALLQNACHLVYQTLRKTGQFPDRESFAKEFLSATQDLFQTICELSSEVEQVLLMLIALSNLGGRLHTKHYDLGNIELLFSQQERQLSELEEQGIIIHTVKGGKKMYSFASSMMEWWVIQKIRNSNEIELQQRQKVLFKLISRRRVEQVTKAVQWLWQSKDQALSILNWIGKERSHHTPF
ncbi:MAG: ATP-binding protein [Symploca sp. SIO2E9]|nr:ATP-binding protein [Symploca sp. SIO2E9]